VFQAELGFGDCEYTEEPLIIDRTLLCSAPKREEDCDAGEPSGVWSGRGDHLNSCGIGMADDASPQMY
jgi:hypothetical protein